MGSIAAANPGLADALQLITNSASPALSSLMSSPSVQAALENASTSDLVELSDQALQVQMVDGLFGNADGSQTDPSTTTTSSSLASQLAIYQDQQQGQDSQALNVNLLG